MSVRKVGSPCRASILHHRPDVLFVNCACCFCVVVLNGASSPSGDVTSGVPQGSNLGPVFFIIFSIYFGKNVFCNINKFANNPKLDKKAQTDLEIQQIQLDLNKIVECSEKWQMKFNVD